MSSTFAPDSIKAARLYVLSAFGIKDPNAVGIVGDTSHQKNGSSYHLGEPQLRDDSYSIVESSRDRRGLSDAASALDVGKFALARGGKTHNLRTFSAWLVAQCEAGAPDTLDIREVIYSPDGESVRRWDRLRRRSTGDSSHLEHTHISWFRDSEDRDKTALFRRYISEIEEDDMPSLDEIRKAIREEADYALRHWTEENPDSTKTPREQLRVGGLIRMSEQRERNRIEGLQRTVLAIAQAQGVDAAAVTQQLQQISAQVDQVDESVAAAIFGGTNEQLARVILDAVGRDRAAELGALLQAQAA